MTARIGTLAVDGTPISGADLARVEAEEKLHAEWRSKAVLVVASAANDVADCRQLLDMLGLDPRESGRAASTTRAKAGSARTGATSRTETAKSAKAGTAPKQTRKRSTRAA
jgi:hypothetical protein